MAKSQTRKRPPEIDSVVLQFLQTEIMQSIAQMHPHLLPVAKNIFAVAARKPANTSIAGLQRAFVKELLRQVNFDRDFPSAAEAFPQMPFREIARSLRARLQQDVKAAFARTRLKISLKKKEKLEIFQGMLRTRFLDARCKKLFVSSEVPLPNGTPFQGKGFRSMGQEAIYAAGIRLQRRPDGKDAAAYSGDFVAPMIRDLGLALAMGQKPYDVMAAQMGKPGIPTRGKDLHIGDFSRGILPPAAPITISTGTACGLALALRGSSRVVINCNGDGSTSAGEWHEVVNFASVHRLPLVFVLQNNQTALSTPVEQQFACSALAQRAIAYGIRGITIDGTDPEAVFAAVTEAAEACRRGEGPVFVELVCMRMCGHAHHDDMLYFGHEPDQFLHYPAPAEGGYIDRDQFAYWRRRDPIECYRQKLFAEGLLTTAACERLEKEVQEEIEAAAQQVIRAGWPEVTIVHEPVVTDGAPVAHREPLRARRTPFPEQVHWQPAETPGFQPEANGKTFWQAIAEALEEELRRDPAVFLLGEDIGGAYGNAFLILKSLLAAFGERMLNTPLAEGAIIAAATGAALLGKRPVAEIQFNDFVACGFNQLVNNTAKIFPRWQHPVPVTIRLPWGGLRQAGPYHSQNTEPWFYRTPGLKIVCPSTPREAKGLLKAAIRDDNPVLFYEHIALYRAAGIKQHLPGPEADFVLPIGPAHLKRAGTDLTVITYGAYVHRCLQAAEKVEQEKGISCAIVDVRTLLPLDREAILASVQQTGRALIVHEDSKTGGIGQSIASIIAEEAFEYLDAPVRVLGALDAPVPYSPPLEAAFLVSEKQIEEAMTLLVGY